MSRDDREYFGRTHSGLVPGLIVAGIGVLFLLNNLNIIYVHDWWRFWPVILIAVGVVKLVDSPDHGEKSGGAVMLIVGAIFLAANLGIVTWAVWQLWPVILIGIGLLMLFNRTSGFHMGVRYRNAPATCARADALAIFGGFKRQVTGDDFRGARYVAIFGGGEIDLRRAQIQGEAAVIEINAIFGGFEIKVPNNWIVVNEVVGIFGGTGDETMHPSPDAPGVKQLIVKGVAIFGGVGFKN